VAQAWAELMHRLGHSRYVAQGGDQGAAVTDDMARQGPEGLIGVHLNLLRTALGSVAGLPAESEQEQAALEAVDTFRKSGFGYFLEQSTRPQTIGYALLDSPVALAGWMLDHDTDSYNKISRAFVDGQPAGGLTRDHIAVVLGGRTGGSARRPPDPSCGDDPGHLYHLPRRDLPGAAQLGGEDIPEPRLLQRGRQGRALRGLGGAAIVRRRDASGLRAAARREDLMSSVQQAPGLTRTDLQQHDLSVPGREVIQNRVDIAPEAPPIRHWHPGEEIIYVLEGTLEYEIDGQSPTRVSAGEALMVPAEAVHAVRNVGDGNATELATYVVEKGKPLLNLAE
jgi:quercetin dioxygenase-like cupin family protein